VTRIRVLGLKDLLNAGVACLGVTLDLGEFITSAALVLKLEHIFGRAHGFTRPFSPRRSFPSSSSAWSRSCYFDLTKEGSSRFGPSPLIA
jgi:hypothetical protein